MRRALNENPVVQAALVGVLALSVGLVLLTRMGSGGSSEEAPAEPAATTAPATTATATTPASASTASVPGAEAVPAEPAAGASAATPAAEASPSGFEAGPGLPEQVVSAYEAGDEVVLLIVNERGLDDRELRAMVEALRSQPGVALFVTDVREVARYSRITEGVELDRTPALVVLEPKALSKGSMPRADVSYGFRGGASVRQALQDALYQGPSDLPYHPE